MKLIEKHFPVGCDFQKLPGISTCVSYYVDNNLIIFTTDVLVRSR